MSTLRDLNEAVNCYFLPAGHNVMCVILLLMSLAPYFTFMALFQIGSATFVPPVPSFLYQIPLTLMSPFSNISHFLIKHILLPQVQICFTPGWFGVKRSMEFLRVDGEDESSVIVLSDSLPLNKCVFDRSGPAEETPQYH